MHKSLAFFISIKFKYLYAEVNSTYCPQHFSKHKAFRSRSKVGFRYLNQDLVCTEVPELKTVSYISHA